MIFPRKNHHPPQRSRAWRVGESDGVAVHSQAQPGGRSAAVFGEDEIDGRPAGATRIGVVAAVQQGHDVGVLFEGSGLAKIAQLRLFVGALFGAAVELAQGQDGDVEFLSKDLQPTADLGHFLLAAGVAGAPGHQLQVVDDDQVQVGSLGQPTGLGADVVQGQGGGVVDVERGPRQGGPAGGELGCGRPG